MHDYIEKSLYTMIDYEQNKINANCQHCVETYFAQNTKLFIHKFLQVREQIVLDIQQLAEINFLDPFRLNKCDTFKIKFSVKVQPTLII